MDDATECDRGPAADGGRDGGVLLSLCEVFFGFRQGVGSRFPVCLPGRPIVMPENDSRPPSRAVAVFYGRCGHVIFNPALRPETALGESLRKELNHVPLCCSNRMLGMFGAAAAWRVSERWGGNCGVGSTRAGGAGRRAGGEGPRGPGVPRQQRGTRDLAVPGLRLREPPGRRSSRRCETAARRSSSSRSSCPAPGDVQKAVALKDTVDGYLVYIVT